MRSLKLAVTWLETYSAEKLSYRHLQSNGRLTLTQKKLIDYFVLRSFNFTLQVSEFLIFLNFISFA